MMIEAGAEWTSKWELVYPTLSFRNATHEGPWQVQHTHTHMNMQIDNCVVKGDPVGLSINEHVAPDFLFLAL